MKTQAPQPPQAPATPVEERSRLSSLSEWAVLLVIALFTIGLLVQPFLIPTVSMEDTLMRGDHLLVDKLAYAPSGLVSKYLLPYGEIHRGDIIVFRWPMDLRQTYVKRVIGVPGDHVRLISKQVYLNGHKLEEPYAVHKTSYLDSYRDSFPGEPNVRLPDAALRMLDQNVKNGELIVPPNMYFAMGDNRDNSLDSRYWGFVPRENVLGKPLLVWWSYDAPTEHLADPNIINFAHLADLATNFFRKTRWSRTFRLVRSHPIQ